MAAMFILVARSSQAQAREEQPTCSSPVTLPAALSGWNSHGTVGSAAAADALDEARLQIGKAATASLRHLADVRFVTAPDRPGDAASYAGMLRFVIPEPGQYRVSLGSAAWIDVLTNGKAMTSAPQGHGPDCSGIRKMVDFTLAAGPHVLQLSRSVDSSVKVMVSRAP